MDRDRLDYSKPWAFQVYTSFGRVLKEFPIREDETHHRAGREARRYGLSLGHARWWIRLVEQKGE